MPDTIRLQTITVLAWELIFNDPDTTFKVANAGYRLAKEKGLPKFEAACTNLMGASYHVRGDFHKALEYYNSYKSLCEKLNDRKGVAAALGNIGGIYMQLAEYDNALKYHQQSLQIEYELGNKKGIAGSLTSIGLIYDHISNFSMALDYQFQSLRIYEEINDKNGIANVVGEIGFIFHELGDDERALTYHLRSLELKKEIGNEHGIAISLGNLGLTYDAMGEHDKALKYFKEGVAMMEGLGDVATAATGYSSIGNILCTQGKYDEAMVYHLKSLESRRITVDRNGEGIALGGIGQVYLKKKNYKMAIKYLVEATEIFDFIGDLDTEKFFQSSLYEAYKYSGNYDLALIHYERFIALKDSIFNDKKQKEIVRKELQFEYEKEVAADSIKAAEESKVQEAMLSAQDAQLKKENTFRKVLYGGFTIILLFSAFIFNRFRVTSSQKKIIEKQKTIVENQKTEVEKQKIIVEEKNKEILDSIMYAKRIQAAILPPDKLVKEFLHDSFIFYKPKDIVAGDFYWMQSFTDPDISLEKKSNDVLFAAADCTGHGVPGAMVSVVCHNALNRSVREFGIETPGEILDKTREIVIEEFGKSEENVCDGMDISLCRLSLENNKLHWAGANNPLWIIHDNKLTEYKPDKQPIGNYFESSSFTTHTIDISPGDVFYVFTDGYQDQFGKKNGKKFKASQLKELLLSIHHLPMEKQREKIENEFESWKGELEQVDDVCIIGVRIVGEI